MEAREKPHVRFEPGWEFRWGEPITVNRFHYSMKDIKFQHSGENLTSHPDVLFTIAIIVAKLRFVVNSGLAEMMSIDSVKIFP